MPAIRPLLKPYSEIVKTAAKLFNMSELDAEIEMDARLRKLKIPKIAVVAYINWASHNALSYKEIAEAMGIPKGTVKVHLWHIKRKWKHLFSFGPRPPRLRPDSGWCWGSKGINMDWINAETKRLGVRGMGPMKHLEK